MSDIEWAVLKMICMEQRVHLQRHTHKFSNTFRPMVGDFLKLFVTYLYCTKYKEVKVFHSVVQKHVP